MKKAIFPGSFDPLTLGHYDIILRASELFSEVIVGLGVNSLKKRYFPLKSSLEMIEKAFQQYNNILIVEYDILTVDFCRKNDIKYIVRGIRNVSDFEYERSLADTNRKLFPEIETIFLDSKPEYLPISSTIVREVHRNGGDISSFVPKEVLEILGA